MTYSTEWDAIYAAGQQMNRWPWSDLVSAVKRYFPDLKGKRVLELGCGISMPNLDFFAKEGANWLGIDGALQMNGNQAGYLTAWRRWDFTASLPDGPFDMICDRAAVCHNDYESIKRCIDLAYAALNPGGYYIGIDWFSSRHNASKMGAPVDPWTRTGIPSGQFKGVGKVFFATQARLEEIFKQFEIIDLAHKTVRHRAGGTFAAFNIIARKPA